jgi:hypothetical protein
MEQVRWYPEVDALSAYRALEQIQDGRHKRGVRYSVALILMLMVLGKLAGMTMPLGIAEYPISRRGNRVREGTDEGRCSEAERDS